MIRITGLTFIRIIVVMYGLDLVNIHKVDIIDIYRILPLIIPLGCHRHTWNVPVSSDLLRLLLWLLEISIQGWPPPRTRNRPIISRCWLCFLLVLNLEPTDPLGHPLG